jgi:tetratricopeptide (TPR) repeat protein
VNDSKRGSPPPDEVRPDIAALPSPADPLVQTLASPTGTLRSLPGHSIHGQPSFAAGDFIAGRYRVIRFLAEGGMGEVYECEDRLLGEAVALKTIRPEIANDASIIERFRREIQLARRVTHPNVCRIFDVGIHRRSADDGGPEIDLAFLTMELLPGQTLAERLRAVRPMPRPEALAIITQVAGALAAAHDAGVVHRDFKPQNVILVPSTREGGAFRAVVTDFGLARGRVPDPRGADNVTGAGGIVGSPAYMAPEQVEGGDVGPAADLYALGVVLYEMVTGVLPYVGETPLATAAKRLKGPPMLPSLHIPDLDPAWERAILRCLEREPAARFAQADDLPAALRGERRLPAPSAGRADRIGRIRRSQKWRALAIGAALVVGGITAGAGAAVWSHRGNRSAQVAEDARADLTTARLHGQPLVPTLPGDVEKMFAGVPENLRQDAIEKYRLAGKTLSHFNWWKLENDGCPDRTVAVIGFKNLSGDEDVAWLSTALTEMMGTELAAGEKLRTVPSESVARMKRELDLGDAESYAEDTLARIRENVCATHVLVGSYVAQGESGKGPLRLDLRLQDTSTGETIAMVSKNGSQDQLIDLVGAAGAQLRQKVGAGELSPAETANSRAALPRSSEAARPYAEGLAKMRREECRDAQELLEEAVKADPSLAQAHAALAEALWCVGYEERGSVEAKRAFELSATLPRRERLQVQGTVWSLTGENEKALEAYQTLWEFYPEEIEIGLKLAGQQLVLRKEKEFRETVKQLRKLPAPDNQHPRIDLYEASLAFLNNDQAGARAALERAARRADNRGAKLMAAAARMELAMIYVDSGEAAVARAAGQNILDVGREYGDRELESVGLDVLAMLDGMEGSLKSAEERERASLKVVREVGIRRRLARGVIHLSTILMLQGRLDDAEAELKGLPPTTGGSADKMKDKQMRMWSDPGVQIARLAMLRGDLVAADRALAAHDVLIKTIGVATSRQIDKKEADPHLRADALVAHAELMIARGDPAGAKLQLEQARVLAKDRSMPVFLANLDLDLARVLDDGGQHTEAAALAEDVGRRYHEFGMNDFEASARAVQAGALLGANKPVEARAVLDPALDWAERTESQITRLTVGIVDARLLAALGDEPSRRSATQKLAMLVGLGQKLSLGSLELEAALALGEQELATGQTASGRARLARVERVAKEKGFSSFARRAAAAVGS